ncbi:MAG: DUF1640 domain-containing protein [Nitrospirae bacterium]|nr:DUF1640 domain-containing protein [Nitrospirota bacterium]
MKETQFFDTHAYVKKLKAAGFTEEQAEIQAETLSEIVEERLTTKRDLKELELRLTVRLGAIMAAGIVIAAVLVKLLSH